MKDRVKNLFSSIGENLIYDILKCLFLSVFSGGLSYVISFQALKKIAFDKINVDLWIIVVISISITALVVFFTILIYAKVSKKFIRSEKIESEYEILSRIVNFRYDKPTAYYEADIKLKFNQKTRQYYGKFYWSGSGSGEIKVQNRNFNLQILKQRTRYIEYVITFDKAYKRGKTLTLHLKGKMNDPNNEFSPYFSTTIRVPTRHLVVTLDIDQEKYPIQDLEKEIIPPQQYQHENAESIELDECGKYEWKITNPQIAYQYSFNWSFCS